MNLNDQLLRVSDTFAAARGISRARLSTLVLRQGQKLDLIAEGRSDLTTGSWQRAMQWFSDNWPEGAEWPEDVARPARTPVIEAAPEPAAARPVEPGPPGARQPGVRREAPASGTDGRDAPELVEGDGGRG